jgi:hypothetical protein
MAVPLFDTSTPLAPLRERLHAKLARTHLAMPMSPVLSREQAAEVTEAARAVSANRMR